MSRRIRERSWNDFAGWCAARGLAALPAHPWTVAAYARWCEHRFPYRAILMRVKAIARVHLLECHHPPDRHPTVTRTLRRIEARFGSRGDRAALFRAEDFFGGGRTPMAPAPSPAAVKPRPPSRAKVRPLRSTPRLVPRRPPGA